MFNFSLDKINNLIKLDFQYIVLISFVLYTLFYYCSANLNITKPDIKTIVFLLGFHVAHMFIVKKFYLQKDTAIAILILICPIIIYKLYAMYQRKQDMDYNMKMRFMMAQIQAMQQAQQQAQRQYVSPPVQQAQQNTNSQQLQYNELNRSLQGGNNGQHQNKLCFDIRGHTASDRVNLVCIQAGQQGGSCLQVLSGRIPKISCCYPSKNEV